MFQLIFIKKIIHTSAPFLKGELSKDRLMIKNIYFIEPKSPSLHIFSRTLIPRIGSILLATILKNKGYNTKVFVENIAEIDWKLFDDVDLVCISSITSTAKRAFKIAERFKKSGKPVVMGGVHSTFLPDESLQYADYVVRGEGEETIVELVESIQENKPLNSIKGLSFKDNGNIVHNPSRDLLDDLNIGPIPDLSLVYKWNNPKVIPLVTSRGCPFGCNFCSVIPMFGRKYRFKTIDRIIEEIKIISSQNKKIHIFFVDDNFTANKERSKELLRRLIDDNMDIEWSAQVRSDVAKDPELIELMRKSGCFGVYIGFESINPETLKLFNKNQKLEDAEACITLLKKHSINIHGMFVLGADTDNIETIKNTEKYAKKLNINSVQFLILTPLPGTPVFEDLKKQGRLIHTDWSKYDAHHTVFEPKLMTASELHIQTLKSMSKFYSWYAMFRNLLRLDFFHTIICLYGKKSVNQVIAESKVYIKNLSEMVIKEFDNRTNKIRLKLQGQDKTQSVVFDIASLDKNEFNFFANFIKKLSKKVVIAKEDLNKYKNSILIVHVPKNLQNKYQQISEYYENNYKKSPKSIKFLNIESNSLYNICKDIGLLLNITSDKIRNAFEKSLKFNNKNTTINNLALVLVKNF